MPSVSILMNCRNCEEFLKEALDSVQKQTFVDYEVIFVDNQSSDSSAEIFSTYQDKRFKYHKTPEYLKLGEARNYGINKCKGDFIAFLDCDDIWSKEKIEKQIIKFEDSNIGIVICDTIFFKGKRNIKQIYKHKKPPTGYVWSELINNYFISMETVIIRNSLLKENNIKFDTRYNCIEEFDLLVKLSKISKLEYVDEPLAMWRIHDESLTQKSLESFADEFDIFLKENFNELNEFQRENIINTTSRYRFLGNWMKHSGEKARKVFDNCNTKRNSIYYISFFMNYNLYIKIKNFVNEFFTKYAK